MWPCSHDQASNTGNQKHDAHPWTTMEQMTSVQYAHALTCASAAFRDAHLAFRSPVASCRHPEKHSACTLKCSMPHAAPQSTAHAHSNEVSGHLQCDRTASLEPHFVHPPFPSAPFNTTPKQSNPQRSTTRVHTPSHQSYAAPLTALCGSNMHSSSPTLLAPANAAPDKAQRVCTHSTPVARCTSSRLFPQ
jgi:hypothetical protein